MKLATFNICCVVSGSTEFRMKLRVMLTIIFFAPLNIELIQGMEDVITDKQRIYRFESV